MKTYLVTITPYAKTQIKEIIDYISNNLNNPLAASNLLSNIKSSLKKLDLFPESHPLVSREPWASYGIHKLIINHVIAYYWVDDNECLVHVIAVVNARMDQINSLKKAMN